MRWSLCSLVLILLPSAQAAAQIVVDMTPERIKEAIAFGSNAKDLPLPTLDRPHKSGGLRCARRFDDLDKVR